MRTETKRDLHADLAICNAATAGPWFQEEAYDLAVRSGAEGTQVIYAVGDDMSYLGIDDVDATFITEARTGWPIAIERAINAEAEAKRLGGEVSGLAEDNERLYEVIADMQATMKPIDHCDSCAHLNVELAQHRAVRSSYLAENEHLKALLDEWRQTLTLEEALDEALREIDTHIRATSDPIPHIVATLRRVLPEYDEEADE